ncbi:RNA polymerase sigma factor [Paenibacillus dauci]|uniref:RNA polymerase sigma factor n=1 Tax=Paenibacillus dauci TaxID=1567106 RepID=UPI0006981308|nr:RNA polymerase sigma factor [Paenibacillus dauci]
MAFVYSTAHTVNSNSNSQRSCYSDEIPFNEIYDQGSASISIQSATESPVRKMSLAHSNTTYETTASVMQPTSIDESVTPFVNSDNLELQPLLHSLYKYCLHLTHSSWDAEDLMQETCLKVMPMLTEPNAFQNTNLKPEAYIVRAARNLWIDIVRRRTNLQHKQILLQADQTDSNTDSGYQRLESEWAAALLLHQLSSWQHAVFVLRDLFGYPAAETARILDTTEGAIKAALHRARAVVRSLQDRIQADDHIALPLPDEQDQALLRSYLAAFRNGQAEDMVRLLLDPAVDPIAIAPQVIRQARCTLRQTTAVPPTSYYRLTGSGSRMLMSA